MKVNFMKLNENAIIPKRGSNDAAGYDLYACTSEKIVIPPHQSVMIGTGLAFELPDGYFGGIFARSGLACKLGLRPGNCVGVVDSDYRGEVKVALHNDTDIPQMINPMERISQMILLPYITMEFNEVDNLDNTERGTGGFGSTGK